MASPAKNSTSINPEKVPSDNPPDLLGTTMSSVIMKDTSKIPLGKQSLKKNLTLSIPVSSLSSKTDKDEGKKITSPAKKDLNVTPPIENIVDSSTTDETLPKKSPGTLPKIRKRIPVLEQSAYPHNPSNVAVPRSGSSRKITVNLDERPLVIAVHVVPSLPIALFEIVAEILESATGKSVVLLYEARVDRTVAKDLVDIAILPASGNWDNGYLLPISFNFDHRLNKDKNPAVYVDVVLAQNCSRNVEQIIDLRGYRCALADRRKALGAAGLLFSHLKSKGENPSFFGNVLDSGSQVAALQMVAGNQAEVGVLESPVINSHRNILPGMDSLHILASLGPLPPYRIMLNNNIKATLRDQIKESLLGVEKDTEWMQRLKEFGVSGFAEYSENRYNDENITSVVTSVPYY